ncbi:hypothetical protein LP420_37625 [Massilia sp. B-10]|nr:hypothetical protein LP420_37625 [Massilia sp. B-10]
MSSHTRRQSHGRRLHAGPQRALSAAPAWASRCAASVNWRNARAAAGRAAPACALHAYHDRECLAMVTKPRAASSAALRASVSPRAAMSSTVLLIMASWRAQAVLAPSAASSASSATSARLPAAAAAAYQFAGQAGGVGMLAQAGMQGGERASRLGQGRALIGAVNEPLLAAAGQLAGAMPCMIVPVALRVSAIISQRQVFISCMVERSLLFCMPSGLAAAARFPLLMCRAATVAACIGRTVCACSHQARAAAARAVLRPAGARPRTGLRKNILPAD